MKKLYLLLIIVILIVGFGCKETGEEPGITILPDTITQSSETPDPTTETQDTTAKSNDATLSALSASCNPLKQTFDSQTTEYSVACGLGTLSSTFNATASHSSATIKIQNSEVTSGTDSSGISLSYGKTPITIQVTAEDGTTTKNYTIKTYRAPNAQQAYIKAANADAGDWFGGQVKLDGDTLVVASQENSNQTTITNGTTASSDNSANKSGAVYVYKRSGTTWVQEAYLKASNAETGDGFGTYLYFMYLDYGPIAIDGDTIVVGTSVEDSSQNTITNGPIAPNDNNATDSGAVYVYKRSGTTWVQEAYLKASNAEAGDAFGQSVAIDGDTIVVGAKFEDSNQTTTTSGSTASADNSAVTSGAAYVFKRTGSNWVQEAYLKASNSESDDRFGFSVAIDIDTIVVGATLEDSSQTSIINGSSTSANNDAEWAGAVYVFGRTGSTWAQQAYIKASNADAGDQFGYSLSIDSGTLLVGAHYEDSNQTTITNGSSSSADNSSSGSGAVYVYKSNGGIWSQEAYLKAPIAGNPGRFGGQLEISADIIAVTAVGESSNQTSISYDGTAVTDISAGGSGAVYVFTRIGSTWSANSFIKAPNADTYDRLTSVSISGTTIVAGATEEDSDQTTITNGSQASSDNSLSNSGAVYVFK